MSYKFLKGAVIFLSFIVAGISVGVFIALLTSNTDSNFDSSETRPLLSTEPTLEPIES